MKKKVMTKKTRKTLIIILTVAAILIALTIIGLSALFAFLNKINKVDNSEIEVVPQTEETFEIDDELSEEESEITMAPEDVVWNGEKITVMQDDAVKNILLIGQDRREGQGRQRSDTMIICSINTKTEEIILTSIMRDLYVPIPGYSDNRINAAYQFGGMPLLDQVIEESLGIHIDGNVEVDFDGFIGALTEVGDLDIELNSAEAEYFNKNYNWGVGAGVNTLSPEQVLIYARTRSVGHSDWERTDRQRRVVMASFHKVKDYGLTALMDMASNIMPYLTTDMSNIDILGYVYTIVTNGITDMESNRIPVEGTYSCETLRKGMEVLVPDLSANSKYLQSYIYGE